MTRLEAPRRQQLAGDPFSVTLLPCSLSAQTPPVYYWSLSSILSPTSSRAVTQLLHPTLHGYTPALYTSLSKPSPVSYRLSFISSQLPSDLPPFCSFFISLRAVPVSRPPGLLSRSHSPPPLFHHVMRSPGGVMDFSQSRNSFLLEWILLDKQVG